MAKKNEALVLWDKQLADDAAKSVAAVANLGGGQFFSIKGGKLALGDTKMPNNEVILVALDSVFENVCYVGDYDPDAASSPVCYAFGHDLDTLKPHEAVRKPVCDACKSCPNNEFGSAARGRGKACKNRVRIACIAAGTVTSNRFEPFDAESLRSQTVAYLGVPPTSLGAWGTYVKSCAAAMKRPPYGVYTKVRLVPDDKVQVRLEFECVDKIGSNLGGVVLAKRDEAVAGIIFPYPEREETTKKPSKKRRF